MSEPRSDVAAIPVPAQAAADLVPARRGDAVSPGDGPLEAEFAAKHASADAGVAAQAAATSKAASEDASAAASVVARRAKAATAAAVAAAAMTAAEAAAAAADTVEEETIARAIEAAAAAVAALETVAAERAPGGDDAAADRAAAVVATIVAAEVISSESTAAAVAGAVALAVTAAAEAAATAAWRAALSVERQAGLAARVSYAAVEASATTVAAADVVVESTKRVVNLATRLRIATALRDSEQRFRVTFDNSTIGMMLVSLVPETAGRLLRVNPALRAITGRPDVELLQMCVVDFFLAGDQRQQATEFSSLARGAISAYEAHALWNHATGRDLWVHASLHAIREENGRPAYAVCQVADITERRRAEDSLRRREERFRLAFDNAITGMAFLTADGAFRKVNNALTAFLGYGEAELLGQRLESLACEADQPSIRAGIAGVICGEFTSYQAEHSFVHADGRTVWGLLSGTLEQEAGEHPDYLVLQIKDISARKEAETLLVHQAMHDELTGLPNRVLLADHLSAACERAKRAATQVAVMFIDIDDFKEINDTLGHVAGDDVLIEVAARLRGCLRDYDIAARLGGDEFVVVCEGLQEPAAIQDVIDQIDSVLSIPMTVGPAELQLSVSVGVNIAGAPADPAELMRGADTAMYHAKTNGKDRYEIYDAQMSVRSQRHVTIGGELSRALEREELRLHYQPTYDMHTGSITGVEALLRWQHPTRGLLGPAEFLDVAEGRRMMVPIGDWVLSTAVEQTGRWHRAFGERAPDMWVNIAGQQLGRQHLIGVVEDILASNGVPAEKLGLEVTERQLIGKEDSVKDDLVALRALGLRLAIDDFGTGFASYEYLRRFTFDEIKIDRSFVSGLGRERTDTAVTTSVIALGRSLDLVVVAEGVETIKQYRLLQGMGCDLAQGYLMQRPATPEAIEALLEGEVRYSTA